MKRLGIMSIVVIAIIAVLWLKLRDAPETGRTVAHTSPTIAERGQSVAAATVLLFADPREAESSCGCSEIIRIARSANDASGVTMREFDTRRRDEQAERHSVRVSPTVIIVGPDGAEQERFEGESGQVIARLRAAIDALSQHSPAPAGSEKR